MWKDTVQKEMQRFQVSMNGKTGELRQTVLVSATETGRVQVDDGDPARRRFIASATGTSCCAGRSKRRFREALVTQKAASAKVAM